MAFNPFEETKEVDEQLFVRLDNLIHRTFQQSESGRELLDMWKESLIMNPTVTPNSTQFDAGIEEGKKTFIRNILITIQQVEGGINE